MDEKARADKLKQLEALIDTFNTHLSDYKSNYDESNTRADFIDKLFALLGWDMDNSAGYSEDFRDVVREDKVKIEGKTKAPDYSFRIGGTRQFFVEAKQPNVNLKNDPAPAYQVRRYGWNAKCPISILTDFEEFAIYDTSIKPGQNDKAGTARIDFFTYKQYIEKFDFLYNTFSPEAIKKGSLKQFIKEDKKGTSSVDSDFLNSLSSWRILLAESIAKKNPSLDEIDLNKAVQKIMNRLVFIRFAEDRGTSTYGELKKITELKGGRIDALRALFDSARTQYNSDLFANDELINGLQIEDSVLKEIILNFYVPKSPYQFDVFPIELLGTIYERFLGQTITLGSRHKALIEDKPETRKAGGVYYTPAYIVEYIVQNTLGKLLEGKAPEDIQTLSVVDPACGSGSFLIKVYDTLLRWYLDYYSASPQKHIRAKRLVDAGGGYKLTVHEKQQILLRHVYGVDLDSQAVEVTKLSLMLKLMEGEQPLDNAGLSFTYLPNLEHNIKHGNSLVGSDYLLNVQAELFDKKEQHKIKVFDWDREFPEIFKRGGFDCVVGNPPYNNYSARNSMFAFYKNNKMFSAYEALKQINNYCINKYPHSSSGVTDLYKWFLDKALQIKQTSGKMSFIIPDTFIKLESYSDVRSLFGPNYSFQSFGFEVFAGKAVVSTGVFIYPDKPTKNKTSTTRTWDRTLGDILTLREGQHIPRKDLLSDKRLIPVVDSKNMSRYLTTECISYYQKKSDYVITDGDRIIIQKTGYPIYASTIEGKSYVIQNLYQSIELKTPLSIFFILGLLNSKFLTYYYRNILNPGTEGVFSQFRLGELNKLPIPALDLGNKAQKAQHDALVEKVQQMLDFHKRLHAAPEPEKPTLKMQIAALDRQIDALVYRLYGLDEGERQVVEGE